MSSRLVTKVGGVPKWRDCDEALGLLGKICSAPAEEKREEFPHGAVLVYLDHHGSVGTNKSMQRTR